MRCAVAVLFLALAGRDVAGGPIPRPDWERFLPVVQQQLQEAHDQLEAGLADPATPTARRAALWGDLATTYHAYGLVAAARESYRQASAAAPSDPRWSYYLGQLERSHGEPDAAIGALRHAVELDPRLLVAWLSLGEALLARGDVDGAQAAFGAALQLSPACAPALVGQAQVARLQGRYAAARDSLQAALLAEPEADSIHQRLAAVARLLGDEAAAARSLQRAGRRQPSIADPLMGHLESLKLGSHNSMRRAQQAVIAGRIEEAIAIYREVLRETPQHARALTNLGAALARLDRLDEARLALNQAVELEPADARTRFDLGTVLLRSGDAAGAIVQLERSLAIDPRQPAARFNLGGAYRRSDRHQEALAQFEALVELAPAAASGGVGGALLLFRRGRYLEARAGLEASTRALPDTPSLEHALARLLAACPDDRVRDGERAVALAGKVVRRVPSLEHERTMGLALAEAGQFGAAIARLRSALAAAYEHGLPPRQVLDLESDLRSYQSARPVRVANWYPARADESADAGPGDAP